MPSTPKPQSYLSHLHRGTPRARWVAFANQADAERHQNIHKANVRGGVEPSTHVKPGVRWSLADGYKS